MVSACSPAFLAAVTRMQIAAQADGCDGTLEEVDAWCDEDEANVVNLEGHRSDCRLVLVSYELLDGEAFDREAIVAAIQRDDVA